MCIRDRCGSPFFIFRQLFYPNQPCRIVLSIQITRRMVVFWLTNFKKNGTIAVSYTHLDVYKRQPKLSSAAWRSPRIADTPTPSAMIKGTVMGLSLIHI